MTDAEIRAQMSERLLAAQNPIGRARLNLYVKWKRLAWNGVTGFAYLVKRVFDIVLSIVAMILLAPVFIALAIAVKLDGGPVFDLARGTGGPTPRRTHERTPVWQPVSATA